MITMHGILCNLTALDPTSSHQAGDITVHAICPGDDVPRRRRPESTALICHRGSVTVFSTDPRGTRMEETLSDGDVYVIAPHAPFSLHCGSEATAAALIVEVATTLQPLATS
ncbi:hypothetical protein [Corynebacterium renale]|uniref:hypothetical protein n=2 Tax=Corynebacterium renale TaxID=1724 RepID=UPI0011AB3350|nr:hypothetical protein [Corynebacterium renale]